MESILSSFKNPFAGKLYYTFLWGFEQVDQGSSKEKSDEGVLQIINDRYHVYANYGKHKG